jgi:prephenate dehydrogenase
VTDTLLADLRTAGNEVIEVAPAEHDEAMKTVQGRAHAAVLAFALVADDVPPALSTPIFEGLTDLVEQVTGNTPRVYADVQATFDGAADVAAAARRLADADRETFEELYAAAGENRRGDDGDADGVDDARE